MWNMEAPTTQFFWPLINKEKKERCQAMLNKVAELSGTDTWIRINGQDERGQNCDLDQVQISDYNHKKVTVYDREIKRSTTFSLSEINEIFVQASAEERWKGILEVTCEPLVSSDILGTTAGAIVDLNHTRVVGGNLVKVFAWYDNEWGYSAMLLRQVLEIGKLIK